MRFTKIVNEPFDYIKYASLSALGFAFVENLTYFNESSLNIIHGRALTAVVSHMFNSSIIAYGIILNKYKQHKNPYLNFIFFFTLASISHGLYDFWLINKSASEFSIFTVLLLIISMYVWNSFKNNALNQSNFYDKEKSIDNERLYDYLLYSLTGILLFEYLALALNYSPSIANKEIISSIYSGTYLIFFLTVNLSKFSIIAGKWAPIKYWDTDNDDNEYENLVGTELKITSFTNNEYANKFLPNSGKITQRLTVYNEKDWYLIKLNYPKEESTYLSDTVIIRTKDKYESLEKGQKTIVAFYLIPKETNLKKSNLKRTHFKFCGWATTI